MQRPSERELLWMRRVRDLSHMLASERQVDKLLPRILDAAIELTGAERGFLVRLRDSQAGGRLRFKVDVARGFNKSSIMGSGARFSRTVVQRVVERGGGLVTTDEQDEDVLAVSSVRHDAVLSIVCVPLCLRGETRGALYLDHRFRDEAFTAEDLPLLQTFADQAASGRGACRRSI